MATQDIPAELERRIRALESPSGQGEDFDGSSWFWLLFLGVALPILALIIGWSL
ncbi:hypothetical protein [Dongia mobilis]|jgi:hypothetical protein|uniref:hypothetical protein n=1 Tax=Dongia sp. TaxID=1977262 RepID=UPI0026F23FA5